MVDVERLWRVSNLEMDPQMINLELAALARGRCLPCALALNVELA